VPRQATGLLTLPRLHCRPHQEPIGLLVVKGRPSQHRLTALGKLTLADVTIQQGGWSLHLLENLQEMAQLGHPQWLDDPLLPPGDAEDSVFTGGTCHTTLLRQQQDIARAEEACVDGEPKVSSV